MRHRLLPSLLAALALSAGRGFAADVPPELVSRFTTQVQPLVVNRCAAGACHGGPAGHPPRFERGTTSTRPDRTHTLANMDTFLATVGTDRDPRRLVAMLAGRHPATPLKTGLAAKPLTPSERITIESWLAAVRAAETGGRRIDHAVQQASATAAAPPARNRFRDLLDTAASPPALPPPQEPQGVIFRKDDESLPEPPVAPAPP